MNSVAATYKPSHGPFLIAPSASIAGITIGPFGATIHLVSADGVERALPPIPLDETDRSPDPTLAGLVQLEADREAKAAEALDEEWRQAQVAFLAVDSQRKLHWAKAERFSRVAQDLRAISPIAAE